MGKLMTRLEKQLKTEHKKDAEDCIEIYNYLKSTDKDGCVWSSRWSPLAAVSWSGTYPRGVATYKPSNIGAVFLNGIRKKS